MQALSFQKNAALPRLQTPCQSAPPARCPRELLGVFLQLLPFAELFDLPSLAGKRFYKRLFCPGVTLWYFIFQRLQPDHSLDNVLCDAHNGGADALRPELSKKLLSTATASFSNARKRLPLAFLSDVLKLQAQRIPVGGYSQLLILPRRGKSLPTPISTGQPHSLILIAVHSSQRR